ncbi:MAG: tripartite tricarboxylate transporter substrate binding protein [Xanthomonadales bacterium]|nr:tripartite tricarboxylate transporter substrate binding protein [Xanthomonadales bacterium]
MASRRHTLTLLALSAAALLGSPAAHADEAWPTRVIQIITPASAGSGTDILARALAQRLAVALKQPVIVDNRPGASGAVGISAVHKAAADGYTLLYSNASTAVIAPAIVKSLPYDFGKDFVPVAQTAAGGVYLLVNRDVPARNLRELIDLIKANPDTYNSYGSWAIGSSGHLMMEWLKKQTGMKMTHVPYRTVPQLLTELANGALKVAWADPGSPVPFVRSGRIRGIAISGSVRGPQLPDIATLDEQGYRFDQLGWFGVFAPTGTNEAIVNRLSEEINKIQASPEMATLMKTVNFEPPPVKTAAQFRDIVQNDLQAWKKLAAEAGVSGDN